MVIQIYTISSVVFFFFATIFYLSLHFSEEPRFFPVVGTTIGAAVGAGVGFLGSMGAKAFGNHGVSSAKESINDVIKRSRQSVESKIRQDIIQIRNQANRRRNLLIQQVDKEIRSVDAIDDIVDELKQQIHNI